MLVICKVFNVAFPCHIMCIKVCCPLKYVWKILIYHNISYHIWILTARSQITCCSVVSVSPPIVRCSSQLHHKIWRKEMRCKSRIWLHVNLQHQLQCMEKKLQSCSWWVLYTKYSLIRTSFSLSCLASSLRFIKLSSSNFSLNFPQWFTFTAKLPNNLMWAKLEIGV